MVTLKKLEQRIADVTDRDQSLVRAWAEKVATMDVGLAKEFEWSLDCFKATARIRVAELTACTIENAHARHPNDEHAIIGIVRLTAKNEAMRGARFPELSTSPTSNLVSMFITQAWAELAEWLGE